jgi:dihydropyrimidinase
MSKVIKNGTIVTADRSWTADMLYKHRRIISLGPDLVAPRKVEHTGIPVAGA